MEKSLKQIFKYQNCIGILAKDNTQNGFYYLPTNDLGLYQDVMSLPSEEVDWVNVICKINIIGKYYIVYVEENNSCWDKEFDTMEEAIYAIIKREEERNGELD